MARPPDNIDLDNLAESIFPGINAQHREQMAALQRIERKVDILMSKMDDFRRDFTAFLKRVSDWIAKANANQTTSDAAVAAALAAQQAGQDVDMQALSDELAAAAATVPDDPGAPPTVPPGA